MTNFAIIGAGVIGAGWAARFALNGHTVRIFDPAVDASVKMDEVLRLAQHAWQDLYDTPLPAMGEIIFCDTVAETVKNANWIQENTPEVITIKHQVLAEIQAHCPSDAIIASSTSGFTPSQLRQNAKNLQQIIVAHPFNPVYLLPLVELVGLQADTAQTEQVTQLVRTLGMYPLHVRKEIDAHIADRFLEAVWREALWLVKDGVATTAEIDEAIRLGFGLRWAQMGLFETYRVAGGTAGMKHFMAQFGPCLSLPWTKLMDVPEYNTALIDLIADQSDAQSGQYSIRELETIRDQNLVGFMRHLKKQNWAAGITIAQHETEIAEKNVKQVKKSNKKGIIPILEPLMLRVAPSWIDYNGHMTESRYLFCASEASDCLLDAIGAGLVYVASGYSYYTAETHIVHRNEARLGDALHVQMYILGYDNKRLHQLAVITCNDVAVACVEQLTLHVNSKEGKVCPASNHIVNRIAELQALQPDTIPSDYVGRHIKFAKKIP